MKRLGALQQPLAFMAFVLAATWLSETAWAQVQIQTRVSSNVVEVGQTLFVEGVAMSNQAAPTQPRLRVPQGVTVRGPSIGSNHAMSFGSGGMVTQRGITAKWQLVFSKVGSYQLGPISMLTADGRIDGDVVTVKVVPEGKGPRPARRRRSIFDDDFFPSHPSSIFDDLLKDLQPATPQAPAEYQLNVPAPGRDFLRALTAPQRVVVGQQVTLKMLAYHAGGRFGLGVGHEARHPDFYAHDLPRSGRPQWYNVNIEGVDYSAVEIRAKALFPLKAGELVIGPMDMEFRGPGQHPTQQGPVARSQPVAIHVVEPPLAGRPPGYQLGDVGDYTLSVTVAPRRIPRGGSISVTANLEGIGNVPAHLLTPDQKGVQWLQPTLREHLELKAGDRVGGNRTFVYVVELDREGTIDLGELRLPYYSPTRHRYETARVELGRVVVEAGGAVAPADTQKDPTPKLSALVPPRSLGTTPELGMTRTWASRRGYWIAALLPPLGVALGGLTFRRGSAWLTRRRKRQHTPARVARGAVAEAENSLRNGDRNGALSSIERALFLAIEGACGTRARGILRAELAARLTDSGLDSPTAAKLVDTLNACEQARFQSDANAADVVADAKVLVTRLTKMRVPAPTSGANS